MLTFTVSPGLRVVGLSGSPTHPSRSAALLRVALQALADAGADTQEIALRELPAEALLQADATQPPLVAALAQVARAEVVLVATPIYKAAYSGLLKTFLDLLPQDGLRHKIVLPLATGGSAGHLLALDYALKPVLGALGARHILDAVFATDLQFDVDEVHGRRPSAEVRERLAQALAPLSAAPLLLGDGDVPAGVAPHPAAARMHC